MLHDSSIRINRSDWLIIQAQRLIEFGKEHNLASSFIYACLEARLALEKADLDIVLASIGPEERLEIIELSKPKNGIERQGKKIGALKERYQIFIINVFKALDMQTNFYDFKKSKILQNKLTPLARFCKACPSLKAFAMRQLPNHNPQRKTQNHN